MIVDLLECTSSSDGSSDGNSSGSSSSAGIINIGR